MWPDGSQPDGVLVFGYMWLAVKDGDDAARGIFDRHYSRIHYADGRKPRLFVGPGEKFVLVTPNYDALFVWRKFKSNDRQQGVNCAVFRNEGPVLSSILILAAEELAWQRWPGERLYTYVAGHKIRSPNPGYCFKCAQWKLCGETKINKLLIFEKYPPPHVIGTSTNGSHADGALSRRKPAAARDVY